MSVSRDFAKLPRGTHTFAWRPPGRGHYTVRIEARGPSGPAGVETRTVKVKLPKPKPKREEEEEEGRAAQTDQGKSVGRRGRRGLPPQALLGHGVRGDAGDPGRAAPCHPRGRTRPACSAARSPRRSSSRRRPAARRRRCRTSGRRNRPGRCPMPPCGKPAQSIVAGVELAVGARARGVGGHRDLRLLQRVRRVAALGGRAPADDRLGRARRPARGLTGAGDLGRRLRRRAGSGAAA